MAETEKQRTKAIFWMRAHIRDLQLKLRSLQNHTEGDCLEGYHFFHRDYVKKFKDGLHPVCMFCGTRQS